MATTTLLQRHAGEGETIAEAIRDCLDYGKDPEKTASGKYISAYECDPATVADEFLWQGQLCRYDGPGTEEEIMCCAIRYDNPSIRAKSPPKEANRIGYELAMRWTKGRHAFIVTTHTDKQHIHCHIYYNSTTLDCTRKFRNFGAPASPFGGSLTGCALKTGCPSWRTRSPGARASIGTMGSGRKTGKDRFPIRTDCALLLILRWRNAPLIWTNFSI